MRIVDLVSGAFYLMRGFRLLWRPGLRRFVVAPLLVNIAVFGALFWLGIHYYGAFVDWLLPTTWHWLRYLLWPLFALFALAFGYYAFTMVANLLGAPFNEHLVRKTASMLASQSVVVRDVSGLASLSITLLGELRKWLYFLLLIGLLTLLWLLPLTAAFAPLLWLALGAWMLAFEYVDYPMSQAGLGFAEKRRWLRRHRWLALGFGGATLAASVLPIVNLAVMPAAVIGATALWVERGEARA